jgi:hypothetical protein
MAGVIRHTQRNAISGAAMRDLTEGGSGQARAIVIDAIKAAG